MEVNGWNGIVVDETSYRSQQNATKQKTENMTTHSDTHGGDDDDDDDERKNQTNLEHLSPQKKTVLHSLSNCC